MKTVAKNTRSNFWAAAFLMATSAIGPGFLTQTTVFTQKLMASFGFVILVSILLDIGVQLNIWRIITGIRKPAQEIADTLLPGMGLFLAILIVSGGLAFNIGNIAGAGMGLSVITGLDSRLSAFCSVLLAIGLLLSKNSAVTIGNFVKVMGLLMILLTAYVAIVAKPDMAEVLHRSFIPESIDPMAVITIVGGTVGGYICFAGAHRLLETNNGESFDQKEVSGAAIKGILTASLMRLLLFLAAFGVLSTGLAPDPANPAAGIFRLAAGERGYRLFGIVMWIAAITSVIGSAFTAISFISTYHPLLQKNKRICMIAFILISLVILLWIGKPVKVLVWAGMINGFILPVALLILLAAVAKEKSRLGYTHPKWLTISGVLIALTLAVLAGQVILSSA